MSLLYRCEADNTRLHNLKSSPKVPSTVLVEAKTSLFWEKESTTEGFDSAIPIVIFLCAMSNLAYTTFQIF